MWIQRVFAHIPIPLNTMDRYTKRKVEALLESTTIQVNTCRHPRTVHATGEVIYGCLTSTATPGTIPVAIESSGLIAGNNSSVYVENVHIKGYFYPTPSTINGLLHAPCIRRVVVCWHKPRLEVTPAGTLPSSLSFIEVNSTSSDQVNAFVFTDTANAGSFTILDDKRFQLGAFGYDGTTSNAGISGPQVITMDDIIPIKKRVYFKRPCTSTYPGGHFDSTIDEGQVVTNLLMVYYIVSRESYQIGMDFNHRITYSE